MTDRMSFASEWDTVQRVMLPSADDVDASALYALVDTEHPAVLLDRTSLRLPPRAGVSFATYFGALPVGVWRAHTGIEQVRLSMTVDGEVLITVWLSDALGAARALHSAEATGDVEIILDVRQVEGGGWLWFDARASSDAVIGDAAWSVPAAESTPTATATVCITTLDREPDCVALLGRIGADSALRARVDRVVVVDQGSRRLRDAGGFREVQQVLGDRLSVIEQDNFGGSGGFSRGMIEAVSGGSSHALLLDDDVVVETDAIVRLIALASHARRSLVVGGQMLSLVDRTTLHTMGEVVDRDAFWWSPVAPQLAPIDLADAPLASTPALHRLYDVDFNGWWMCLVPTDLIRRAGASLPLFIKWDDAEFGLRASSLGVPTVTLPGAALWHMPWTAKDDGLDWQAYFQLRNRLVTALIHSPHRRGGRLLRASLAQDVNHILCLQYGSASLRRRAMVDVLSGPHHLEHMLAGRLDQIRAVLALTGQVVVPTELVPPIAHARAIPTEPPGRMSALRRLVRVGVHQLRASPRGVGVQAHLDRRESKWWALGTLDVASVASATGTGSFVSRRDRRVALRALTSAMGLRVRLWWRWPTLAREYRRAAPGLASLSSWERRLPPKM